MSLTAMLASLVCVVASVVMLWSTRGTASRAAHAVVLAAMLVLALGMQHIALTVVCAVALAGTALVLLRHRTEPEARSCALDVAVCSGLVALMAVSSVLGGASADGMKMDDMSAGATHDPLRTVILGSATLLLVGGWALTRRAPMPAAKAGGIAAWLMMLAMAAMVTTA